MYKYINTNTNTLTCLSIDHIANLLRDSIPPSMLRNILFLIPRNWQEVNHTSSKVMVFSSVYILNLVRKINSKPHLTISNGYDKKAFPIKQTIPNLLEITCICRTKDSMKCKHRWATQATLHTYRCHTR